MKTLTLSITLFLISLMTNAQTTAISSTAQLSEKNYYSGTWKNGQVIWTDISFTIYEDKIFANDKANSVYSIYSTEYSTEKSAKWYAYDENGTQCAIKLNLTSKDKITLTIIYDTYLITYHITDMI
jgi:hypothetical protein